MRKFSLNYAVKLYAIFNSGYVTHDSVYAIEKSVRGTE